MKKNLNRQERCRLDGLLLKAKQNIINTGEKRELLDLIGDGLSPDKLGKPLLKVVR